MKCISFEAVGSNLLLHWLSRWQKRSLCTWAGNTRNVKPLHELKCLPYTCLVVFQAYGAEVLFNWSISEILLERNIKFIAQIFYFLFVLKRSNNNLKPSNRAVNALLKIIFSGLLQLEWADGRCTKKIMGPLGFETTTIRFVRIMVAWKTCVSWKKLFFFFNADESLSKSWLSDFRFDWRIEKSWAILFDWILFSLVFLLCFGIKLLRLRLNDQKSFRIKMMIV